MLHMHLASCTDVACHVVSLHAVCTEVWIVDIVCSTPAWETSIRLLTTRLRISTQSPPPTLTGTYCHQREVEAITEPISEEEGCLCCSCCKIPGILSFNSAVAQRWFTWEVVSSCYILKGYSIAENQLYLMFNTHEYRKSYLTFLVQVPYHL